MKFPQKPPDDADLEKIILGKSDIKEIEEIRHHIEIINDQYLHWDELQVDDRFKKVNLKEIWAFVSLFRKFNARLIRLNGKSLRYVQTRQIEKNLHDMDFMIGGEMALDIIPSQELQKKYLINSIMEEAIASSQLEGAATSRVVAKAMLRENRKPRNPSEQMIVNNYLAMMFIKDNAQPDQKLTIELIKEIHKKITKDTLKNKEWEGSFRADNEVKVWYYDQIVHNPPDSGTIEKLLEQVCNFANNESKEYYLHPLIKAIILHYLIGYIHPFNDGNGRTARALFYWYLITQKYNKLEYVAVSTAIKKAPSKYMRAYLYKQTDHEDITYFVKFNLRAINIALRFFEKYIEKTRSETRKIFEAVRHNPKLNFRQADIIINLSKHERPLTINEMQERYNITYQTARTDLLGLSKEFYLHKIKKGKQFLFILNKEKCIT